MCDCPWDPKAIAGLLKFAEGHGESEDLWMGARDFADLRKFARDVLDMNVHAPTWKNGLMGTIYGKSIDISGAIAGWISVRDADGKVLAHALKGGLREEGTVAHAHHLGPPRSCLDPDCIVRYVMIG